MEKGHSMYTVVISPVVTGTTDWTIYSEKGSGKETLVVSMGGE